MKFVVFKKTKAGVELEVGPLAGLIVIAPFSPDLVAALMKLL